MKEIYENAKRIIELTAAAAVQAGKNPEEVAIVAASKMNPPENIRMAFDAGIRAFGENRVQEFTEKNALGAYDGAAKHFIGHLQKNKVRHIVGECDVIESVDSAALMQLISARALSLGITQSIMFEVNIGGEESKSGIAPSELDELCAAAAECRGITVAGMMTIPPYCAEKSGSRTYFERMYNLFVDIRAKKYDNVNMQFLSMGMSGDFEDAILAGSNIVRVGTSIFGSRYI